MLNATLFGEMITFGLFVWVTLRFVMPPVNQALKAREDKISAGLSAAEQGQAALVKAQEDAEALLVEAKEKIAQLLQETQARSDRMIEEAQSAGETEKQRLIHTATDEINQQTLAAKKAVQVDLARLITLALERLLGEQVNAEINQRLLQQIILDSED